MKTAEAEALYQDAMGKLQEAATANPPPSLDEWDAGDDTEPIAPRGWLLGNQFCRQFVSSIVAPGATGKSALRLLQYLALATGRPLTGQHIFCRARGLLLSFEDGKDELRRRIQAALMQHQISRNDLQGWFFCATPKALKLTEIHHGARHIGPLEKTLRDAIDRLQLDFIALDPFIKTHGIEESDNGGMDFVCELLATLAIEHNIAVDAPHHTRKGQLAAGDADSGRGASSIRDAWRLVHTLTAMSEDEAKSFGIPDTERRAYVRLDPAKVNIIPSAYQTTWFKLVGVRLNNGTNQYPSGDEVQTVMPWTPPDTWANLSTAALNAALTEIDAGLPNGQRYSDASAAAERSAWLAVQQHCAGKTEQQYREIIRTWVANGVLYREPYDDPIVRKSRSGLRLNHAKRPG